MARYIDADALRKRMFSYYGCINENTAKENYRGVTLMDYEVANLIEDCIDDAPTADVVPKSEVEIRGGSFYFELAKVEERGKQLMREHDSKIAREIFEEVEKSVHSKIPKQIHPIFKNDRDFGDGFRDGKTDALIEVLVLISELKKKYTEGAAADDGSK